MEEKRSLADIARMNTLKPEEMEDEELQDAEEYEEGEETGNEAGEETGAKDYMPRGMGDSEAREAEVRFVHTEPKFEIEGRPTISEMYSFLMYHTYGNVVGILSLAIGIAAIVYLIFGLANGAQAIQLVLSGVVIVMFLMNSPMSLWFKAKKQSETAADPVNTITYGFSPVGCDMWRGEEYAKHDWSEVVKVKESKTGFYFYIGKNHALMVAKAALGNRVDEFRRLIEDNADKKVCRLKSENN